MTDLVPLPKPEEPPPASAARRGFDFKDFSLCTTTGALCYLLAVTLGSGSYADAMPPIPGIIVRSLLLSTLAFLTGVFLLLLTEYTTDKLELGAPKKFEASWLNKFRWLFLILSLIFLVLALLMPAYHFIAEKYPWVIGFIGPRDDQWVNFATITLALLAGLMAVVFFMAYALHEILTDGPRTYAFALVFGFVSGMIWLNAYRDAEKGAMIADSEYCYRLSTYVQAFPSERQNPHDPEFQQARHRYEEDNACKRLLRDKVLHSRYLTEQKS